jgi:hypothetical protein
MSRPIICALAHIALFAVAVPALAQNPTQAARPDPLDARAAVPAPAYEAALAGYRRFDEEPRISWRQANDTAEAIGGWRVYAREAQGTSPAPARSPATRSTP